MATRLEIAKEKKELILMALKKGMKAAAIAADLGLKKPYVWQVTMQLRREGLLGPTEKSANKGSSLNPLTIHRPLVNASVEQVSIVKCPHCHTVMIITK